MDEDSATAVRYVVGVAEDFDVKVGLHQGSALSPCFWFFAIVMDRMPDEIRQEDPSNYNRANDVSVPVSVWHYHESVIFFVFLAVIVLRYGHFVEYMMNMHELMQLTVDCTFPDATSSDHNVCADDIVVCSESK